MKCEVCREEEANEKPPCVCKHCGASMCRFCFVMDKLGDVYCLSHKQFHRQY